MTDNRSVTANFAATVLLVEPSGTKTTWDHTFSWTGLSDATWYLLEVQTSTGGPVLYQWYTADQAGCTGAITSCAVSPAETGGLPNGDYQWRILDWGDYGSGSWTVFTNFKLDSACYPYSLTTIIDPTGSGTISVSSGENCAGGYTYGTVVQLTAVSNPGYKFTNWSGDASGTANTTSVTMTDNRSVTASFAATTLLVEPSGTKTTWDHTFSWTGLSDATWYLLEVQTSTGGPVLYQWYTADQAGCTGAITSCAVSPAETGALPNGDYKWRILDWGDYGSGSWTAFTNFKLNLP